MELLWGLLFTLVLLLCAAPCVLLLLALFSLVAFPLWLESAIVMVLGLTGGLMGQAAVIDVLQGVRSWSGLRHGSSGMLAPLAGYVALGAAAALLSWPIVAALRVPGWLQPVLTAAVGAGATVTVTLWRLPGLRAELLPSLPSAVYLRRGLAFLFVVACMFGPPALLTLAREGRIRPDSQFSELHLVLMFAGIAFAFAVDGWLEKRLLRHGVRPWGE